MQQFKNSLKHINTNNITNIYACQTDSTTAIITATVHNLLITNNNMNSVYVELMLEKLGVSYYCMPKFFELATQTTLEMKPINMMKDDKLNIKISSTPSLSVTTSISGSMDVADDVINVDVIASILEEIADF
jgi:hypothetical protein